MAVAESEPAVENGEDPILGGAECEERKREEGSIYVHSHPVQIGTNCKYN
jgi:hypothetical protein